MDTSRITAIDINNSTGHDVLHGHTLTYACLVAIEGKNSGQCFSMRTTSMVIGRSHECDVTLDDKVASRKHCRIVDSEDGLFIVDLGSTNGTYINGQRAHSQPLVNGDRIKVGDTCFMFLTGEGDEGGLESELKTGLSVDNLIYEYNRSSLHRDLERELYRFGRYNRPVCLVMLHVQQRECLLAGHGATGRDRLLAQLRVLLSAAIRHEDALYRPTPDEFALVLPATTPEQAIALIEELQQLVASTSFELDGATLQITIEAGLAQAGLGVSSPDALLLIAEQRLRNN